MDRGAWWATVHEVAELDTTERVYTHIHTSMDIKIKQNIYFSSVAQSCPTLRDAMNRSTPGLPVHHQLPEFTQTHIHRVMPSSHLILCRPLLLPPIPPSIRVFSNESALRIYLAHSKFKTLETLRVKNRSAVTVLAPSSPCNGR